MQRSATMQRALAIRYRRSILRSKSLPVPMRCLPWIDAADCDGDHRIIEYRCSETSDGGEWYKWELYNLKVHYGASIVVR
jgi:hypothetical protein